MWRQHILTPNSSHIDVWVKDPSASKTDILGVLNSFFRAGCFYNQGSTTLGMRYQMQTGAQYRYLNLAPDVEPDAKPVPDMVRYDVNRP